MPCDMVVLRQNKIKGVVLADGRWLPVACPKCRINALHYVYMYVHMENVYIHSDIA